MTAAPSRRHWVLLAIFCFPASPFSISAEGEGPGDTDIEISIRAELPGARHEIGETIRFEVSVMKGEQPWTAGSLSYTLSDDGYAPMETDTLALTGEKLILKGKLDRPGFLRCQVEALRPGGEVVAKAVAAAAVEPDHISPSRETPVDFDDFWSEQKQRLAAVPIEAELVAVTERKNSELPAGIELFDLKVRTHEDWPVSGYFARPEGARANSLPAVLWTHGAGVKSASITRSLEGANRGYLSLDLNAHGILNAQPAEYYQALTREGGRLHRYASQGRENRDGVYFRGMYLRLIRAIDFLTAQPEWDGRVMAVIGHSQGGGQALVAGGLDPRVTFVGAGVPALCDHTGLLRRRVSGWPRMVPLLPGGRPDPVIAEVSRYFDVVNFAARCQADTIVSVGFVDHVCPPTSCYAAINQLRGPVEILNEPEMGHAAPAEIKATFWQALERHHKERKRALDDAN